VRTGTPTLAQTENPDNTARAPPARTGARAPAPPSTRTKNHDTAAPTAASQSTPATARRSPAVRAPRWRHQQRKPNTATTPTTTTARPSRRARPPARPTRTGAPTTTRPTTHGTTLSNAGGYARPQLQQHYATPTPAHTGAHAPASNVNADADDDGDDDGGGGVAGIHVDIPRAAHTQQDALAGLLSFRGAYPLFFSYDFQIKLILNVFFYLAS
jgi:hypothetical protein